MIACASRLKGKKMNNELNTLQAQVEQILKTSQQARDNNNILIYAVFKLYGVEATDNVATMFLKLIDKKLPSFESITRARRKVVELHPELDASENIKRAREYTEKEYEAFARG